MFENDNRTEGEEILEKIIEAHDLQRSDLVGELRLHAEQYMDYMSEPLERTPHDTHNWESGNVTRALVVPLAEFIKSFDEVVFGPI